MSFMRRTAMLICVSPMPDRMVSRVLVSCRQRKVGSCSHSRVRVGLILAASALVLGVMATEYKGFG